MKILNKSGPGNCLREFQRVGFETPCGYYLS